VSSFPFLACFVYSYGRKFFLKKLIEERPEQVELPAELAREFWGIKFRSPLFNAAGMFKDGKGYELACLQGAGAFLAGTVTPEPRKGNACKGVRHPFLPFPLSVSSSNWMGLPNPGLKAVLNVLKTIEKKPGVPLGLSLASDSDSLSDLETFVRALYRVEDSNIDFIEINESCPNVQHSGRDYSSLDEKFVARMEYIAKNFLRERKRNLPVIVKLSNDFAIEFVPNLIDLLLELGYDGLNFGNTSTNYKEISDLINPAEKNAYDFFVSNFGGGVSGIPLKHRSYALTEAAGKYLRTKSLRGEFHIIRTGGITSYKDIQHSQSVGVSLFQWFTGYFAYFEKFGHRLYKEFFI
jgi:dihydroorotate dehydrogenase